MHDEIARVLRMMSSDEAYEICCELSILNSRSNLFVNVLLSHVGAVSDRWSK